MKRFAALSDFGSDRNEGSPEDHAGAREVLPGVCAGMSRFEQQLNFGIGRGAFWKEGLSRKTHSLEILVTVEIIDPREPPKCGKP